MVLFPSIDDNCLKGEYRAVLKYLNQRKDPNRRAKGEHKYHRTPLHAAVLGCHLDLVELLVQWGAQINTRDDLGQTPLHYAANVATPPILDILLANGADYTLRDSRGNLPIHMALTSQNFPNQERLRRHTIENPLEICYFEGGRWLPYDTSNATAVSLELGEGAAYCALVTTSGAAYIVDLKLQIQINASSYFAKSICWRVPGSVWQYPPNPFQGLHPGSQDASFLRSYTPLLQELRSQGLIATPESLSSILPGISAEESHWRPSSRSELSIVPGTDMEPPAVRGSADDLVDRRFSRRATSTNDGEAEAILLRSGSESYNEIVARFVNGMEKPPRRTFGGNADLDSLRPVSVSRVYEIRVPRQKLEEYEGALADRKSARGSANERLAWHGASFKSIQSIIRDGFRVSPEGKRGRLYGQGVYFAPVERAYTSAEFAVPDEHGEKHMLLCRLVTGSLEVVPFESSQSGPSNSEYDTGTDNVEEPSRYVVWEDDVNEHVLPTHIISFRYC